MSSTYYADNYFKPVPEVSDSAGVVCVPFAFTVKTALILNDKIKLAAIKAISGIYLLDWYLNLPAMDSGGTAAWTFDLGDNATAAKFVSNSSKGQTAANVCSQVDGVTGALPVGYTADSDLVLLVHTAPQVGPTDIVVTGFYRYALQGASNALF